MPLHVWIVAAALAAASPSFAGVPASAGAARRADPAAELRLATAVSSPIANSPSALESAFPDLGPTVPASPSAVPASSPPPAASVPPVSVPAPVAPVVAPAVSVPAPVVAPTVPAVASPAPAIVPVVTPPVAAVAPAAPVDVPVAATSPVARPEQIASVPVAGPAAAPAVLPPKIIEVPSPDEEDEEDDGPGHHTADRELLLREFPDQLVEAMWIQDWQDIERLHQYGRLVDIPSDPQGRGIILRLEGGSRIGELEDDPYRQMLLCRLAKPAAGLLYRIASRLRLIEGEAYEPLQITSLVRTWDYQLRLTDVNPNADRTREGVPPTHVLGLAFDIARSQMSYERQKRLEFLFDQLARDGELAYYKEGAMNGLLHYHVIALPSADLQLARYYERESQAVERQEAAVARHRTLPDAPCVTFGSSLEPFSAICSCELPLEVSASQYMADAPVSR